MLRVHGSLIPYTEKIWLLLHVTPPRVISKMGDGLSAYQMPSKLRYELDVMPATRLSDEDINAEKNLFPCGQWYARIYSQ